MTAVDSPPDRPLWAFQRIPAEWCCYWCRRRPIGWLGSYFYCDEHYYRVPMEGDAMSGYAVVRYSWRQTWELTTWRYLHPFKAARQRRASQEYSRRLSEIFKGANL